MSNAKFVEGFSSNLANRWVSTLFTPAFVFWLGGGLAGLQQIGWKRIAQFFSTLPEPLPIGLGVLALLVVSASGFMAQQFEFPVLRLLEGYWPRWCRPLSKRLVKQQKRKWKEIDKQWQDFNRKGLKSLTPEERQDYIQADLQLSSFPDTERLLPTRLGNILRSAEDRCTAKYGLDVIICWPRLWLLLPDAVKTELSASRAALDLTVRMWLWGLLFALWSPVFWVWWPLLLGLVVIWLAYQWMLQAAQMYGDLLESAFDLYRFQLYETLHWPKPTTPTEERTLGKDLTDYLWHGSRQNFPKFIYGKE
ncbi:MAG: hypothetical protein DCF25_21830 [Leptolyngbya foveolarum]|uniref:Uncharacterized protein n=1 Tax=Leptolyngbya foveolarum TaxID=47253 RepID=A0A2W4TRM8_9CYAN|nr:MAG: hypothetical protein DCF25_21830 [Leptolyngbya foveolarum]